MRNKNLECIILYKCMCIRNWFCEQVWEGNVIYIHMDVLGQGQKIMYKHVTQLLKKRIKLFSSCVCANTHRHDKPQRQYCLACVREKQTFFSKRWSYPQSHLKYQACVKLIIALLNALLLQPL